MQNKVVVVTGGSSGIGKACALSFGKRGAQVVITGRKQDKLEEARKELAGKGVQVTIVVSDVSSEKSCQSTVEEVVANFNRIDILINNAGISMRGLFENLELETFKKVMDINFYGTLYMTKYALPYLIESKGSIVGVSSINGYRGTPARTAYSASKYAMNGFMESLRTELLPKKVHVLVACPGFTTSNIRKTSLTESGSEQGYSPLDEGKLMSAEDVAEAVLKGVQKKKRDIILTREGKMAVFLNKWMPGMLDKIVYNKFAREEGSPLEK